MVPSFNIPKLLLLGCLLVGRAASQQLLIQSSIYQGVSASPCTRLLNGTSAIGCQNAGDVGILRKVSTDGELTTALSDGIPSKYSLVLPYSLLTRPNVQKMIQSGKVAGILLLKNVTGFADPSTFSPGETYPNFQFSFYSKSSSAYAWNPTANGLIYDNIPIPIASIWQLDNGSKASVDAVLQAVAFNANRGYSQFPLYSFQFDTLMHAVQDAPTCLRRATCDPLGGWSVWSTFSQTISKTDQKPIIVVSSKLDALSFFHDYSTGLSERSGMIASIAIADALSKSPRSISELQKHIMFTFFNAEAWGFSGSRRFVKDIAQFTCKSNTPTSICPYSSGCNNPCVPDSNFTNINFDRIESVLEFGSVLGSGATGAANFYLHTHDTSNAAATSLIGLLKGPAVSPINGTGSASAVQINSATTPSDAGLPPGSAHSFISQKRSIGTVFVSDFNTQFESKYIDGEFDDFQRYSDASISNMCAMVNKTSRALWTLASGTNDVAPAAVGVNCTLVRVLVDCFTRNITCGFFHQLKGVSGTASQLTGYSGVFQFAKLPTGIPFLVQSLMNRAVRSSTGTTCSEDKDCGDNECISGQCYPRSSKVHPAFGTGLSWDESIGKWQVNDLSEPTWVESRWTFTRYRIFQVLSPTYQAIELVVGVVLTLAGVFGTILSQRFVNKRFKVE
ncbi:Nicastrin-domain-containing protein [Cladochytrium replicatum]|nr:Nicastrin-domain-containing protein [Cladochytrium replicatum]